MAFLLLALGLALVIASKIVYNKRCITGQGIPYNQKEKLLLYGGYGLLGIAFVLAVFNLA